MSSQQSSRIPKISCLDRIEQTFRACRKPMKESSTRTTLSKLFCSAISKTESEESPEESFGSLRVRIDLPIEK